MAKKMNDAQRLRIAKRAMKLAEGVMSYCPGDKWEQEGTKKDRDRFNDLYEKIFGEKGGA